MFEMKEGVEFFVLFALLASASVLFVACIRWLSRRFRHQVLLGIMLLGAIAGTFYLCQALWPAFPEIAGNGLSAMWWIAVAFTINAVVRQFVWEGIFLRDNGPGVPKLVTDLVAFFIYFAALMVVIQAVFHQSLITLFAAASGALTFVLGFSAQNTLGELFSGLSLSGTQTLTKGNWYEIDGSYGRVVNINWRSISMFDPATETVNIFPNSRVAKAVINDFHRPDRNYRLTTLLVVEYRHSPELVTRLIKEALALCSYIQDSPPVDVRIREFTDLGVQYWVLFTLANQDDWWDGANQARIAIWETLNRNGIQLGVRRHDLGSGLEFPAPVDAGKADEDG